MKLVLNLLIPSLVLIATGCDSLDVSKESNSKENESSLTAATSTSSAENDKIRSQYLALTSHSAEARELDLLHKFVVKHKVAGLDHIETYDPKGIIGFCFGRAMAVHIFSKQLGIAQDGVAKLFAIGDLRSTEAPEWRFHVTTIIRNSAGNWIAVDPIMDSPMPMKKWIEKVKQVWDRKNAAHYYIVSPDAILPDLAIFNTPENEKGEHIIELKFNPNDKEGFKARNDVDAHVYELEMSATKKYFSSINESNPLERFNFTELKVNEQRISYNKYFADLNASAMNTSLSQILKSSSGTANPMSFSSSGSSILSTENVGTNSLLSPKLDALAK